MRETVSDLPIVVDAMRRVELARLGRRCKALVESTFETFDFVFARFEVIAGSIKVRSMSYQKSMRQGGEVGYELGRITYSLKNALAIWSMRMCGCPWS